MASCSNLGVGFGGCNMTTAELENEVQRLKIKLQVVVSSLTQNDTLPILGPMKNWEDYETSLRREMAKAGLQD
jgi:hypothetical protein